MTMKPGAFAQHAADLLDYRACKEIVEHLRRVQAYDAARLTTAEWFVLSAAAEALDTILGWRSAPVAPEVPA